MKETNMIVILAGVFLIGLCIGLVTADTAPSLPTVTGISPKGGPLSGGPTVTITGTGFTGTTAVNFGSTPAASFTFNSDTQITATPPGGSAGIVHVTVTTPIGTSITTTADQFTYYPIPTLTNLEPTALPTIPPQTALGMVTGGILWGIAHIEHFPLIIPAIVILLIGIFLYGRKRQRDQLKRVRERLMKKT